MTNAGLQIFLKEISHLSYRQKYLRWQEYLSHTQQSEDHLPCLSIFLQSFPFNAEHWLEYIRLTTFNEFQTALTRNSKSFELWNEYLKQFKILNAGDTVKYKKQLERAIIEVGADTRAGWMYQQFYELISQNFRFQFYKKVFVKALIGLESIFQKFQKWFAALGDDQIKIIQTKEARGSTWADPRKELYTSIQTQFHKTMSYRQKRLDLQGKIKNWYFCGQEDHQEEQEWRNLIKLDRQYGVVDNISYCYERSLMARTSDLTLWEQAFHYLQNQTNKYQKVINLLRNNKSFFLTFSPSLFFYWCDMQERENPSTARKMYLQMCQLQPSLQIYERYIQFQIRQKQWQNAKQVYDLMLGTFTQKKDLLAYVVVEYCEFVVKYIKDFEYPKRLYNSYFEYLPYNDYLFTNYLQFMKNFENKEGYYDQLMALIQTALKKAKQSLPGAAFDQVLKMVKYYLRSTLGSIYLIKISQRRVMEFQEKLLHE